MNNRVSLSLEKSTNVRSAAPDRGRPPGARLGAHKGVAPLLVRYGLKALDLVAPPLSTHFAARLFFTPLRRRVNEQPQVVGLPAHRFELAGGGEKLALWDWGAGPTVVLVHGWSGWAGQMAPFVRPLVSAGYHVVAFDLPAHGHSSGRTTDVPSMARAVRAIGERLKPIHGIVAHSLGAYAAALAVAQGLEVDSLALLAPASDSANWFIARHVERLGLPVRRAAGVADLAQRRVGVDFETFHLRRLAPAQKARLLVLHDGADEEVPFTQGRALAEAWPGGRIIRLSGLGHRRLLRDADVVEATVDFMRGDDQSVDDARRVFEERASTR